MNDPQIPSGSPAFPKNLQANEGPWDKIGAFLKRDVKSFFSRDDKARTGNEQMEAGSQPVASTLADIPVESLVDFSKLADLAFKREVLDWRDNFHAAVTITASRLQDTFIEQVDAELAKTNLFRKVVARPSNEILQDHFSRIVCLPLIAALRKEEAELNATAEKWALGGKVDLAFEIVELDAVCASLDDLAFKPSKKNLILARIRTLILGPAGIAECLRDQGTSLSGKLMEAKKS